MARQEVGTRTTFCLVAVRHRNGAVGLAAMGSLGVARATDGQVHAVLELAEGHCATCLADGVQVTTGCTHGKGNIERLGYGKFGLTLVDKRTGRAVRVTPRGEAMMHDPWCEFREIRKTGVPASKIPAGIADPLVELIATAPDETLLTIGQVCAYAWKETMPTFRTLACEQCADRLIERNARVRDGRILCVPCAGYAR
jgi:formylmethanofuran dehydrogenase subunit E